MALYPTIISIMERAAIMTMARGLATVVGSVLISTGVFCLLLITAEGGSEHLTVIKRRFISMFSPPSSGIFFLN